MKKRDQIRIIETLVKESTNKDSINDGKALVRYIAKLKFGDTVLIEQFRYSVENEHYRYKVIGASNESNKWVDVPANGPQIETLHETIEPVVSCIMEGVSETKVLNFRVADVVQYW